MLNQSTLSTAEEVCPGNCSEEVLRDDRGQVGFTDSLLQLVKALRKVENPMECQTTLGRAVARRAKEKCTKDSDFNPSMVNSEILVETVIGVVAQTGVHEEQSVSGSVAKRHS